MCLKLLFVERNWSEFNELLLVAGFWNFLYKLKLIVGKGEFTSLFDAFRTCKTFALMIFRKKNFRLIVNRALASNGPLIWKKFLVHLYITKKLLILNPSSSNGIWKNQSWIPKLQKPPLSQISYHKKFPLFIPDTQMKYHPIMYFHHDNGKSLKMFNNFLWKKTWIDEYSYFLCIWGIR